MRVRIRVRVGILANARTPSVAQSFDIDPDEPMGF